MVTLKRDKVKVRDALFLVKHYAKSGDFCTNFPDHIKGFHLEKACKIHDVQYTAEDKLTYDDEALLIQAGRIHEDTRAESDEWFCADISSISNDLIALIMYAGVRIFGWLYWRK